MKIKGLKRIFLLGIGSTKHYEEARQLEFTNKVLVFFSFVSWFYILLFIWLNHFGLAGLIFINFFSHQICLALNHLGKTKASNLLLIGETTLAICLATAIIGRESTGHYFLVFLVPLAALLFKNESKPLKTVSISIPFLAFILLEVTNFKFMYAVDFPDNINRLISITVFFVTGIILLAIMLFYINTFNHVKNTLNQSLALYPLTERELEIISILVKGKTNKQIAEQLYIEESTVKNHLKRVFKKLNIKSRTELMTKCLPIH